MRSKTVSLTTEPKELFDARKAYGLKLGTLLNQIAAGDDRAGRGAVFTQPQVVRCILDLVGYDEMRDLSSLRLLEPCFGEGEFLLPAIERLLGAYAQRGGTPGRAGQELLDCVRGVELHSQSYLAMCNKVKQRLCAWGMQETAAQSLVAAWLKQDDFLLTKIPDRFDTIVGNPPYLRHERISAPLLAEYRARYKTIYDRADLYIPFFERCLDLLNPQGRLGFVCANRWIKNRYGGPLRDKISKGFCLRYYVDLEEIRAFQEQVLAYPAITVMEAYSPSSPRTPTRVARASQIEVADLKKISAALLDPAASSSTRVGELPQVVQGTDPWLLDDPVVLPLLRKLEAEFPTLQEAGCKVGIGVATGADRVFIGEYETLPVEQSRKLPLLMSTDLHQGEIRWQGRGVINPFQEDGSLVDLKAYPRLAQYLQQNRAQVESRYVARKQPERWYRTIDRIYPALTSRPKLLIPDIKGQASVVYDPGKYYPHHNLYVVTSASWDLRALQSVLRSSVALMFIAAYSVRMSGGFLRFQAQYLRRIRLPPWHTVPLELQADLVTASARTIQAQIDAPVFRMFGLSTEDARTVSQFADKARVPARRSLAPA